MENSASVDKPKYKILVVETEQLNKIYPGFGDEIKHHIALSHEKWTMLHNESVNSFFANVEILDIFKQLLNHMIMLMNTTGYSVCLVV